MERNIPHIKNIFSTPSSRKKSTSDTQDLCSYDKSPRSRRKTKEDYFDFDRKPDTNYKNASPKKKSDNFTIGKGNYKTKPEEEPRKPGSSNRNINYNTYSSKTLTERDMRHLERHLSMKKTIRKQISRNLAQAFLENPSIFEPEEKKESPKSETQKKQELSKSNTANSEQNVLDLLKISIEDRDSGHSSPTHENTDTDYDEDEADDVRGWRSSMKHRNSETKGLVDDKTKHHDIDKKTSIWKMFSPRNKGKR